MTEVSSPMILPADTTGRIALPRRLAVFLVRVWFPDQEQKDPVSPTGQWVERHVVHETKWKARCLMEAKLREHKVEGWTSIRTELVPADLWSLIEHDRLPASRSTFASHSARAGTTGGFNRRRRH